MKKKIIKKQVWNIGLTKETDDRLKNSGIKISKALKQTYKNNSKIIKKQIETRKQTLKNNPKIIMRLINEK